MKQVDPKSPEHRRKVKIALLLLAVMFTSWTVAYNTSIHDLKVVGLVAGLLSFLGVLTLVFENFDPNDEGGGR
ncbi:MAG TPA: hypothetical protein V6D17_07890, partial [Candidatus Obscuribacterales bacterium]